MPKPSERIFQILKSHQIENSTADEDICAILEYLDEEYAREHADYDINNNDHGLDRNTK